MHEWAPTNKHFVNEDAKCVPINWLAMTFVHDNLRSKIFRRATNGISPLIIADLFDEAKI